MTKQPKQPKNLYNSRQAGLLAQEQIEDTKNKMESGIFESINFGIPALDNIMLPLFAGELMTILGRPGNGKSLLAQYIFYNHVSKLKDDREQGKSLNKYAVWVSWEVSIEVFAMYMIARHTGISVTDMKRGKLSDLDLHYIGQGALKLGTLPIYIIGHSTQRRDRYEYNPLTMNRVRDSLAYIVNHERDLVSDSKVEISLTVMDYLQLIESEKGQRKDRQFYQDMIEECKKVVIPCGCPNIVPVQAKRAVDDRRVRQPTKQDAEETSRVEHVSDCMMSVCIAGSYPDLLGQSIDWYRGWNIPDFTATKDIMVVNSIKQKDVESNLMFPLRIQPQYLKIESVNLKGLQ